MKLHFNVRNFYSSETLFEASVDIQGCSYLIIYGKHINGYFCALPRWGRACEMSDPSDVYFNARSLSESGFDPLLAEAIAGAIKYISETKDGTRPT